MIETLPTSSPKVIGFRLSGKLHDRGLQVVRASRRRRCGSRGQSPLLLAVRGLSRLGLARRLGRSSVGTQALPRLRPHSDGRRPQVGKVDGRTVEALHSGNGAVFRCVRNRCRLELDRRRLRQYSYLRLRRHAPPGCFRNCLAHRVNQRAIKTISHTMNFRIAMAQNQTIWTKAQSEVWPPHGQYPGRPSMDDGQIDESLQNDERHSDQHYPLSGYGCGPNSFLENIVHGDLLSV